MFDFGAASNGVFCTTTACVNFYTRISSCPTIFNQMILTWPSCPRLEPLNLPLTRLVIQFSFGTLHVSKMSYGFRERSMRFAASKTPVREAFIPPVCFASSSRRFSSNIPSIQDGATISHNQTKEAAYIPPTSKTPNYHDHQYYIYKKSEQASRQTPSGSRIYTRRRADQLASAPSLSGLKRPQKSHCFLAQSSPVLFATVPSECPPARSSLFSPKIMTPSDLPAA